VRSSERAGNESEARAPEVCRGAPRARRPARRRAGAGWAAALWLAAGPALADSPLDPLDVPLGLGPTPEQQIALAPAERIERAAKELGSRGYPQLPVLALALLVDGASPEDVERGVELAPEIPSLRIEAALERRSELDALAALGGLFTSFPCLGWLLSLLSGAAAAGLCLAAAVLAACAFLHSVSLHVHALGHRVGRPLEPAAAVALLAALSFLPLLGLGPATVLAVLGALGIVRLAPRAALACGCALALACLWVGPGLDLWSRLVFSPAENAAIWAAWRIERAQPLPSDFALLERAVQEEPDDLVYRLALATYFKRLGDLERAQQQIATVPPTASPELQARAINFSGILELARGNLDAALQQFGRARSLQESAAVLYNLSQAHARNLNLDKRHEMFESALELDPDLVGRYAARSGTSIHDYLIQEPVPAHLFLPHLLVRSDDADAFSAQLRTRLLGFAAPRWLWLALAAVALCAVWLRRANLLRCRRCDRPVCGRCTPAAAVAETCLRCERLLTSRARVDARVREEQSRVDRRVQRLLRWQRAALTLLLPGIGSWFAGRPFLGWLRICVFAFALSLPAVAQQLPVPFEVGRLALVLPLGAAAGVGLVVYLWALLESRAWILGRYV
jgi:tetratricopeptide (TPR) repeat protein